MDQGVTAVPKASRAAVSWVNLCLPSSSDGAVGLSLSLLLLLNLLAEIGDQAGLLVHH